MAHKISIVGMGYVGCGNALMLARHNEVSIVDIDQEKVNDFNLGKLPILDSYAQEYFNEQELNISATINLNESIKSSTFIILALPTDFDEHTLSYDTSSLDSVIESVIRINNKATIVIKSTVDIGYTESLKKRFNSINIIYSPEFLREGHALEDSLNPSRIIIGGKDDVCKEFADITLQSVNNHLIPTLMMESGEAESVKLFANTYLAMRVAFFNELDSFCLDNHIRPKEVINGMCLDDRIGPYYNNPSFGFGGLCLPKDSMQLLHRFKHTPKSIIQAIQDSNQLRASFLVKKILDKNPRTIGVYKLAMKKGSDNSRNSSIFKIISGLVKNDIEIFIYDKSMPLSDIEGTTYIDSFKEFTNKSDLIITNRLDDKIKPFFYKLFTRDVFSKD